MKKCRHLLTWHYDDGEIAVGRCVLSERHHLPNSKAYEDKFGKEPKYHQTNGYKVIKVDIK